MVQVAWMILLCHISSCTSSVNTGPALTKIITDNFKLTDTTGTYLWWGNRYFESCLCMSDVISSHLIVMHFFFCHCFPSTRLPIRLLINWDSRSKHFVLPAIESRRPLQPSPRNAHNSKLTNTVTSNATHDFSLLSTTAEKSFDMDDDDVFVD